MKSTTDKFFLRGGFSSSQWNHTKRIDYVDIVESLYENEPILHDSNLLVYQNKLKKYHQRSRCGLSA
jgi:hypothetical protein